MRSFTFIAFAVFSAGICLTPLIAQAGPGEAPEGVVVEWVKEGGPAHAAGMREGDRILRWALLGGDSGEMFEEGAIPSIFEWYRIIVEKPPLGVLRLEAVRGGEKAGYDLSEGRWECTLRPVMEGSVLEKYLEGLKAKREKEWKKTAEAWSEAAAAAESGGSDGLAAWIWIRLAKALPAGEEDEAAEQALRGAMAAAERSGIPAAAVEARVARGLYHENRREFPESEAAYIDAMERQEQICTDCIALARRLGDLVTIFWDTRQLDRCQEYADRAWAILEKQAPEGLDAAGVLLRQGGIAYMRGEPDRVRNLWERSLAIREKILPPDHPEITMTLNNLAVLHESLGRLDDAEAIQIRLLEVSRADDPRGSQYAQSLFNLGVISFKRGDMAEARSYWEPSLEIRLEIDPQGLNAASCMNALALLEQHEGNMAEAADLYRRTLAIQEARAPDSMEVSDTLQNLAVLLGERGDMEEEERVARRALEIRRRIQPGGAGVAKMLNNLGTIVRGRGHAEEAERLYREALAIFEEKQPDGQEIAAVLDNLAGLAYYEGDYETAERYYRKALDWKVSRGEEGLKQALTLGNLGVVAMEAGRLEEAEDNLSRCLQLHEKHAPDGLGISEPLQSRAELSIRRKDYKEALGYLDRALALRSRLSPGSVHEAETLHTQGWALQHLGRAKEALEKYRLAVEAVEIQRERWGGSQEERAKFVEKVRAYYQHYIDLLLDLGKKPSALHVLERSRARGMLELLAERDLLFEADVPRDLDRERRKVYAEYERTQEKLSGLSEGEDTEAVEALRQSLFELGRRREVLRARLREEAPRVASLQCPKPLDAGEVARTLDPGTLLLSYAVGEEDTILFMVGPGGAAVEAVRLPVGSAALAREVRRYRSLIESLADVEPASRHLSDLLLAPAAGRISKAERVLVSPDGPLHFLPFAALADPCKEGRAFACLIESKPLHTVQSATVYGQLLEDRNPDRKRVLCLFADPAYGGNDTSAAGERGSGRLRAGSSEAQPAPLPWSRFEADAIRKAFPGEVCLFVGAEATESNAKRRSRASTHLHFACHGVVDGRFPLDSALLLAEGASAENGRLQAWEIFEELRFDADLVVLSACETALGKEIRGEGLIGLTRAFQFAGGRSVMASLWSVSDGSTAALMDLFYRELGTGATKDEALRRAQVTLIREVVTLDGVQGASLDLDASHPYHWAAFELIGDWR